MNVKRFVAKNMQDALKLVREEFGPDAVILSNERTANGVEIAAALEYDEAQASAELNATDQSNPSKVARLHAKKHLLLQEEMGKARQHINDVRTSSAAPHKKTPASESGRTVATPESDMISQDALSIMRAEIESLKGLIGKSVQSSPEPASVPSTGIAAQQVQKRLSSMCITPEIQNLALGRIGVDADYDEAWALVRRELEKGVGIEHGEIIDQGGVIALVGPTGSGKTMTIGKLAARYVMKFGAESIALVTTDRFRIAAHEQLKVFGRILNVPVLSVDEQNNLDATLDKLSDKRLVLVDTAGLLPSDPCWAQQLQELKMSAHRVQSYLVMSAVGQYQVMRAACHHYQMANLAGTIVTKLDEAVSLGELLSFLIDSRLPVAYYTDGQRVPEDIHMADGGLLVDKAEALLNSSERWVTIQSRETPEPVSSIFSHSA